MNLVELSRPGRKARDFTPAYDLQVLELAERLYEFRRQRERVFADGLFSDPTWDMLLELFIAQGRGRVVAVGDACLASGVPQSTGMRWLGTLGDEGLVVRYDDTIDRRRILLRLSRSGHEKMRRYLVAVADVRGMR